MPLCDFDSVLNPLRLVFALALVLVAPTASAAPVCEPELEAWVARCEKSQGQALEIVTCDRGVLVVRSRGARLDVELRVKSERSFRSAGALGLSPVGQFSDWSGESEPRRQALDALVACANRDPGLPLGSAARAPTRPRERGWPWLLLAGVAALAATAKKPSREAIAAIALGAVTALVRWLAIGGSYFHQNGQGPAWVGYARSDDAGLASYGSGFPEVFGAAARGFGDRPEVGVWLVQALLAGTVVPAAWLLARRLGARPWLAQATALICALDPLLARLAGSESYFAVALSLGMGATAACACAAPQLRSRAFWLPVVAAGLIVAQSVRVHPVAWPAAVITPLPLLFGPGSLRRRALLSAAGGLTIAAVIGVTSGPQIADVLRGSLGQKWLPGASVRWELFEGRAMIALFAAVVALGALLRSWRGVAFAAAGLCTLFLARATDLTSDPNPAITAAHHRLFLPAALTLLVVLATRLGPLRRAQGWVAAGLIAASLAAIPSRRALAAPFTDALEARFADEWKLTLPPGARVAYLERAGSQISVLPLRAGQRAALTPSDADLSLGSLPPPAYYVHSSLCSTRDGAPTCEALERSAKLELVTERRLPARPSMRWHGYQTAEVSVALYRVLP